MHFQKNRQRRRASIRTEALRPIQAVPSTPAAQNDTDVPDIDNYDSENEAGARVEVDNEDDIAEPQGNAEDDDPDAADVPNIGPEGPLAAAAAAVPGVETTDFVIPETQGARTRSANPEQVNNIEKPAFTGVGPKHHVPVEIVKSLDFFRLYFDDEAMTTFVQETNNYAASVGRNVNSRGWSALTEEELWAFFAIVLFLGTLEVRYRRTLWDPKSKYYNKWIASTMECGRFEDILFCLHWVNTAELTREQKRARMREDPFWPISGLLTHLQSNFKRYFASR